MATDTTWIPDTYDTGVVRGDYFARLFEFPSDFPLDGAELRIQVRDKSGALMGSFSDGSGLMVDGLAVRWEILSEVTAAWQPFQKYRYDLEVTIGGQARTYVSGTLTIGEDQTHD